MTAWTPAASGAPVESGRLVAQRYRLEAEIGRGGMGIVYRAVDETNGDVVALKQLLGALDDVEGRRRFEREYRTLASLEHPFIIDVFEYGVDAHGAPYFTMEYLPGRDLRSLPPASVQQLARHIRDVASCLALLHARRFVHRDVSPGNVRMSPEGRAKLIDFGALVPFGVPREIIGTPPCVPPEALAGTSLDQRADLFALGALAYFVLTGRHAYPAGTFRELPAIWKRTPRGPRTLREDVPEALDALVMALLSSDPLARPTTAADVIDRLNTIARLEPEHLDIRGSYLVNPVLIGRDQQMRQIGVSLARARKGRGSAIVFTGPPGCGKSRLLEA